MWQLQFLITIVALQVFETSTTQCGRPVEGYYWRDYQGYVPPDAVPVTQEHPGSPIYVGQVLKNNRLIPGNIHPNNDQIHFAFGWSYLTATENVKILCSKYPNQFQWISSSILQLHSLTQKHLIVGGREGDFINYVGRGLNVPQTGVGRVAIHDTDVNNNDQGIYLTYNNKVYKYPDFQVLVYNWEV